MSALTPWWLPISVAMIAGLGVLVAATVTAETTNARERAARRAEHESARLVELLDAALDLREALLAAAREPLDDSENATTDRLWSVFRARREAVLSEAVRRDAAAWEAAVVGVLDAPGSDGDAVVEREPWESFVTRIGVARRRALR